MRRRSFQLTPDAPLSIRHEAFGVVFPTGSVRTPVQVDAGMVGRLRQGVMSAVSQIWRIELQDPNAQLLKPITVQIPVVRGDGAGVLVLATEYLGGDDLLDAVHRPGGRVRHLWLHLTGEQGRAVLQQATAAGNLGKEGR